MNGLPLYVHPLERPAAAEFARAAKFAKQVARGLLSLEQVLAALLPAAIKAAPDADPYTLSMSLTWWIRDTAQAQYDADWHAEQDIAKAIAPFLARGAKMRVVGETARTANADRLPLYTVKEIIEREAAWWTRMNAEAA